MPDPSDTSDSGGLSPRNRAARGPAPMNPKVAHATDEELASMNDTIHRALDSDSYPTEAEFAEAAKRLSTVEGVEEWAWGHIDRLVAEVKALRERVQVLDRRAESDASRARRRHPHRTNGGSMTCICAREILCADTHAPRCPEHPDHPDYSDTRSCDGEPGCAPDCRDCFPVNDGGDDA